MAQMKEQNKTPEKNTKQKKDNHLADAQFKLLVIRIVRELIRYSKNLKKEMKITLSETEKNSQVTNS